MLDAADEFFGCQGYSSQLFQFFYEELCNDVGATDPDVGESAHMKRLFAMLKAELCGAKQGARLREGRWWNLEGRGLEVLRHKTALFMLLIHIGFQRKWWRSFSESPLVAYDVEGLTVAADDADGLDGEPEGDDNADAAADEAEEAPAAAEAEVLEDLRVGAARSREVIKKKREKTKGSMHYCCLLLANTINARAFAGLCHFARPLMKAFR